MNPDPAINPKVHLQRINLLVSKFCNLHCRMCDYKQILPAWEKELSLAEVQSIIEEGAALGAEILELSGGEPMMRKDIYEIIASAHARGLKVMMMTNGTLTGPAEVKKLLAAGLNSVSISLEGPKALNDRLRGWGNFRKTLQAVKFFIDQRAEHPEFEVYIGITLSKYNYRELVSFSKYLVEEIGVSAITINPFDKAMLLGKNRETRPVEFEISSELIPDLTGELERLIEYGKNAPGKLPAPNYLRKIPDYFQGKKFIPSAGCQIPTTFCGITANGWVFPCWQNPPAGNLRQMSLTEMFHSQNYLDFCELAAVGKCNGCLSSCFIEIHKES